MPFFAVICSVEEPNWIPFGSRHVLSGSAQALGPFASSEEAEQAVADAATSPRDAWPWRSQQITEADNREDALEARFARSEQWPAIADRIGRQEVNPRFDVWWMLAP